MKHKQSKFVMRYDKRGSFFEIIEGKAPTKDGQLWKGETEDGEKIELAGNTNGRPTAYVGWSS